MTYKEKGLIVPLYKVIVIPNVEQCIHTYVKRLIKIRMRAHKLIPGLSYEYRSQYSAVTTLETQRLKGGGVNISL